MNSKNIIPTSLKSLDDILGGGFHNGSLTVIASRPGMGKTSFAMQCAVDMSKNTEKPIYIFSLEMSSEQMKKRYRAISNSDRIIVDDTPAIMLSEIREKLVEAPDIAAIFIDYLQLIRSSGVWQFAGVAEIAGELKLIAKETGIPVICTSQLTRAADERKDRHPILSDIKEPLMQNADVILSVYRDSYYNKTADQFATEIGVLKNRYGGCMTLPFQWSFPKFVECGIDETIECSDEQGQTKSTAMAD